MRLIVLRWVSGCLLEISDSGTQRGKGTRLHPAACEQDEGAGCGFGWSPTLSPAQHTALAGTKAWFRLSSGWSGGTVVLEIIAPVKGICGTNTEASCLAVLNLIVKRGYFIVSVKRMLLSVME